MVPKPGTAIMRMNTALITFILLVQQLALGHQQEMMTHRHLRIGNQTHHSNGGNWFHSTWDYWFPHLHRKHDHNSTSSMRLFHHNHQSNINNGTMMGGGSNQHGMMNSNMANGSWDNVKNNSNQTGDFQMGNFTDEEFGNMFSNVTGYLGNGGDTGGMVGSDFNGTGYPGNGGNMLGGMMGGFNGTGYPRNSSDIGGMMGYFNDSGYQGTGSNMGGLMSGFNGTGYPGNGSDMGGMMGYFNGTDYPGNVSDMGGMMVNFTSYNVTWNNGTAYNPGNGSQMGDIMGNYTADHFVDGMFNDTGSSGNSESNGSDNMMSGGNMMGGN